METAKEQVQPAANSLEQEMLKHDSLEHFISNSLFYTPSGSIIPDPNVVGVKAWTFDDPRVAQHNITGCALQKISLPQDAALDQKIRPHDYIPAIERLSGARFKELEYLGAIPSSRSLSSWKTDCSATHQDLANALKKLGYTFNNGECEVKMLDGEIMPAEFKVERDLHILTGKEKLNLAQLLNFEYDRKTLDLILDIEKNGYDGVYTTDTLVTKGLALIHRSVGLFDKALEKLRRYKVQAQHFSDFESCEVYITPELKKIHQNAKMCDISMERLKVLSLQRRKSQSISSQRTQESTHY